MSPNAFVIAGTSNVSTKLNLSKIIAFLKKHINISISS